MLIYMICNHKKEESLSDRKGYIYWGLYWWYHGKEATCQNNESIMLHGTEWEARDPLPHVSHSIYTNTKQTDTQTGIKHTKGKYVAIPKRLGHVWLQFFFNRFPYLLNFPQKVFGNCPLSMALFSVILVICSRKRSVILNGNVQKEATYKF